jgi:HemY protein
MMRLLIGVILALFVAVGIAWILHEDPGYVLLSIGPWTIETSLAVLVFLVIVTFLLLYWLVRLLIRLLYVPRQVKVAIQQRRLNKSQRLLARGLRELVEGHWKAAENTLKRSAGFSETPALHYIGAARAAQKLKALERRDSYLDKAGELPDKDALMVKLTQTELLLESGQADKAEDILLSLYNVYPRQPRVLELLATSYQQLGYWEKLQRLLPELSKHTLFDESRYLELQLQVYAGLLADVTHTGTLADLHALWKQIPKSLQAQELLLVNYAGYLRDHNAADEAEVLLREALNRRWSEKLVVGYGEIGRGNFTAQLAAAEGWLTQHPKDPYLLLTLGRLAKRSRQLDRAHAYLEQSVAILPSPDTYQELGEILEETGDKEQASQCYRTSLRLLAGQPEQKEGVTLPAPEAGGTALGASLAGNPQPTAT